MQASCASEFVQREPEDTIPSDREPQISVHPIERESSIDTWPSPPPARESEPTAPYAWGGAKFWFGRKKKLPLLDEESTESGRPIPEWAVDMGDGVRAMTTFDLWMSLARGETGGKTRVWRDGMDGWERVEQIPELAYALADSVSFDPPLVTPAPLAAQTPSRPEGKTPLAFAAAEADTLDPPEVGEAGSDPISLPVRVWKMGRRVRSSIAPAKRGGLAFVMGCAVALGAIGLALEHRGEGLPELQALVQAAQAERTTATATAGLGAVFAGPEKMAREAGREKEKEAVLVAPPPPTARQHHEPGQKRARRSMRRR